MTLVQEKDGVYSESLFAFVYGTVTTVDENQVLYCALFSLRGIIFSLEFNLLTEIIIKVWLIYKRFQITITKYQIAIDLHQARVSNEVDSLWAVSPKGQHTNKKVLRWTLYLCPNRFCATGRSMVNHIHDLSFDFEEEYDLSDNGSMALRLYLKYGNVMKFSACRTISVSCFCKASERIEEKINVLKDSMWFLL